MTCPFCHHPADPAEDSTAMVSFYVCPACSEEWSVRWRGNHGTLLLAYTAIDLPESHAVRRHN